jgi:ribose transport system ATP-binding protein
MSVYQDTEAGAQTESAPAVPCLLQMKGVTKRFGGTLALDAVDFSVARGEIHALLGENGAGKSTLIKILAGVYRADEGRITGPDGPQTPGQICPGVAFVHQDLGLVPTASLAENLCIDGYPRRFCLIDWPTTRKAAAAMLAALDLDLDPDRTVGELTPAERSLAAIARALSRAAQVIVLDEPTAMLPEADVSRVLAALSALRKRGMGIVYVSHRLDEVFRLADSVTVLRDGAVRHVGPVGALAPDALVGHILGRTMGRQFPPRAPATDRVVLQVTELRSKHAGPVDLVLRAGEVLALAGLRNSGQDTIGRLVAGILPTRGGTIRQDGKEVKTGSVVAATDAGIGFISSRRIEESLAPMLTVAENLAPTARRVGLRWINGRAEAAQARDMVARYDIRPPRPMLPILSLSGGNQQKVVLARWLSAGLKVLVLEEPTVGVDVGARAEIYARLAEASAKGLAVLLVSSDFQEVAGLADRALIFGRGRVIGALAGADLTIDAIARLTGQGEAA